MGHSYIAIRVLTRVFLQELIERGLTAIKAFSIMMCLQQLNNGHDLPVPLGFLGTLLFVFLQGRNQFGSRGPGGIDGVGKPLEVTC